MSYRDRHGLERRCFFFSSRRRHTRFDCDWSSDVCSSDLLKDLPVTLTVAAGRLALNGEPCEGAALTGLIQRLDLHGVGTIALPQNPEIGRGACRGRVENFVVAVSLKKKKKVGNAGMQLLR